MVPAGGQHAVRVKSAGSREPAATLYFSDSAAAGTRQITMPSVFPKLCENGLRPAKGHQPTPIREDQVFTAAMFLSKFRPTKHGTYSSYYLKHAAENWGATVGLCSYISNGALIKAALYLGLAVEELSEYWPSPNAVVGIHRGDFKRLVGYS